MGTITPLSRRPCPRKSLQLSLKVKIRHDVKLTVRTECHCPAVMIRPRGRWKVENKLRIEQSASVPAITIDPGGERGTRRIVGSAALGVIQIDEVCSGEIRMERNAQQPASDALSTCTSKTAPGEAHR